MEYIVNEIWRPVVGFEGLYEVSNQGRIKALRKIRKNGRKQSHIKVYEEKIMSPSTCKQYPIITLSNYGKVKYSTVHRIVATAFIENTENLPCINHKNGIKDDNRAENLEWCTHKYNSIHSYSIGLQIANKDSEKTKSSHPVCDLDTGVFYYSKKELYLALFNNGMMYDSFLSKLNRNKQMKKRFLSWKKT